MVRRYVWARTLRWQNSRWTTSLMYVIFGVMRLTLPAPACFRLFCLSWSATTLSTCPRTRRSIFIRPFCRDQRLQERSGQGYPWKWNAWNKLTVFVSLSEVKVVNMEICVSFYVPVTSMASAFHPSFLCGQVWNRILSIPNPVICDAGSSDKDKYKSSEEPLRAYLHFLAFSPCTMYVFLLIASFNHPYPRFVYLSSYQSFLSIQLRYIP